MSATNPVATWTPPVNTTQNATAYKANIDACAIVAQRIVDSFAARPTTTPAMTVTIDPGHIFDGTTLTEVAVQTTGTITAPVGNPRIDRVVIDRFTGVASVVTGTPGASPSPPAITAGKVPVCQVLLQTSSTAITNAMIFDERDTAALGRGLLGELGVVNSVTNAMLAQMTSMTVKSNITGSTANAADNSMSSILDAFFSSTQGSLLYRGASAWSALGPGTSGQVLTSQGASANPFWNAASGVFNQQSFTSSGTWTKPGGYDTTAMVLCQVWSPGGGGSGGNAAGGGGGGSYREFWLALSSCGSTESVTVGTGGAGGANTAAGTSGGTSSFGSHVTSYGGSGGGVSNGGCGGGLGSTAATNAFNDCNEGWGSALISTSTGFPWGSITGFKVSVAGGGFFIGGGGGTTAGGAGGAGGNSVWGGGGGGGQSGGAGGTSQFGGAGGAVGGNAGAAPSGGGGQGGSGPTTGGPGGNGKIIITVFA